MGAFEWTLVGLIVLGVVAAVLRPLVASGLPTLRFKGFSIDLPSSRDPRRVFKRAIRKAGGDPRRLPKAAMDEIVAAKQESAQRMAAMGLSAYADVDRNLRSELESEGTLVARLLRGERGMAGSSDSLRILAAHGALAAAEQTSAAGAR